MTSKICILLDENWPEGRRGAKVQWIELDRSGRQLSGGGPCLLKDLPMADSYDVVLPSGAVVLTEVRLPGRNVRRFLKALPNALEDKVSVEAERMHVAVGPKTADGIIPVAVADRLWIEKILKKFFDNNIKVRAMWVETLCVPKEENGWSVAKRGESFCVRTGDYSGMGLDASDPPVTLGMLLEKARDIGAAPRFVSFHIDDAGATPDLEKWGLEFGVEFVGPRPWVLDLADRENGGHSINLMQGEFALPAEEGAATPGYKLTAALVAAIVVIQLGAVMGDWLFLKYQASRINGEIESLFKEAFPEAKAVVDASLQTSRLLAEMRGKAGGYMEDDLIPMLEGVGAGVAAEIEKVGGFRYERGTLVMDLLFKSREDIEKISDNLKKARLDATVRRVQDLESGIQAEIILKR